jgi:cytochrome P450
MSTEAPAAQPAYNLFSPDVLADPYPLYHRMRAEDPVHWNPMFNAWLLTRYADVKAALQDPRVAAGHLDMSVLDTLPEALREPMDAIAQFMALWVIGLNPPEHRRLRHLLNAGFKPRLVENLRPRVQVIADELLDAIQDPGQIDIIRDFAYPLPAMVIADMLGMPAADRPRLRAWSQATVMFLNVGRPEDPAVIEAMHSAMLDMSDYLGALIADRRRAPQDDMISNLIAAEEQGTVLGEQELISTCALLLFAGHETTMNLIGNGLLALLQHPDQYRQLVDDPALTPNAVEEFLRYNGPVPFVWRIAATDFELDGRAIRAGDRILPSPAAANRDPAQFSDPDRLDIRRPNAASHITFGHGIHFCLGAPLARLEGQIAFPKLLRRLPGLQLVSETPAWSPSISVRRLTALPVTCEGVLPA